MLTGKAKEDFEKWFRRLDEQEEEQEWLCYILKEGGEAPVKFFYRFPFPMQFGVYVDMV